MSCCALARLLSSLLLLNLVDATTVTCIVESRTPSNLTTSCSNVLESLNSVDTRLSNHQLRLSNGEHILERVLIFKRVRDISIIGENRTTINCTGGNAGIGFLQSQNIRLEGLVINGCGALFNSTSTNLSDSIDVKTMVYRSAVYFEGCFNVAFDGVHVQYSSGGGVSVYNTIGVIRVIQSRFQCNGRDEGEEFPISGGMYVEFSLCDPGVLYKDCNSSSNNRVNAQYEFQDCHFASNIAQTINSNKGSFVKLIGPHSQHNQQTLGRGGGLALNFIGPAQNISINIANCTFENNSAISGGGLFLSFKGRASDIRILVEDSVFSSNIAYFSGAGISYRIISNTVCSTKVSLHNCKISNNFAENGGGLILLYNHLTASENRQNTLLIDSSRFVENSAKYGSAVDAILYAPSGYSGPHPVFKNCLFKANQVSLTKLLDTESTLTQSFYGTGTFTVSQLPVDFNQSVTFEENIGTPLWGVSSRLAFNSPMEASFIGNVGMEGGAIGLVSFSVLYFHNDVSFKFIRNTAYHHGSAIYSFQYGKQQLLGAALQCPLQYLSSASMDDRNVSFYFEDNCLFNSYMNKPQYGKSIYMTSIEPCVFLCQGNLGIKLTVQNMFSCLGKLVFNSSANVSINEEVSTSGRMFKVEDNYTFTTLYLVPGKVFDLPVTVINDLGLPLPFKSYYARIEGQRSEIIIDRVYRSNTHQTLKVYGPVGANDTVVFESSGQYRFVLRMRIELLPCPPGFYADRLQVTERGVKKLHLSCTCNWNNTSHSVYQGVSCNSAAFEAQVRHIYWIGYVSEYVIIPEHLFTGLCPQGFCYSALDIAPLHKLPSNASFEGLNEKVCGPNRRGILCGECAENYTVYYHSVHFKCAPDDLCNIGFLFFLLSEILPLTVMFLVIVLSNVNFSSGALNGFILFAQVLDSLSIGAYGMLEFQLIKSRPFYYMTLLYRFIYRVLNLDFFTEDELSFCLWRGATTLGILTFKFVTIFYAFLLVLVSILIVNKCKFKIKCFRSLRIATIQSYIIHGLSAFLITCYIKCAQVAFHILIPGRLAGMPVTAPNHNPHIKVVFFSGNVGYLSSAHWPYALPACIVVLIVCLPPPFLLLWYPLGRQGIAKVIMKCSKYSYRLRNGGCSCRGVGVVDKMKPLLDSFQSCYKDNCRYFAGLQFVYRVIILCTFNFTETPLIFYTIVEFEILVMLVVHVIFWPYRETWHNIMDTLIYVNIVLVNGFTMFIYSSSVNFSSTLVYEAGVIQTILIYLPLVYIIGYTTMTVCRVIKPKVIKIKKRTTTALDDGFPARLIQNSYESSYRLDEM